MKRVIYCILLMLFLLLPVRVLAEGYVSISSSSLTIEEGSSKTFTITAYNAIGDVSISSNNSGIASVSTGEWGTGMIDEKQTKTGSITVTGNSVGTTTITLIIDAATFDSEDLSGQTKTINVNVIEKTVTQPEEQTPSNSEQQQPENNLSKNNNLKSLTINDYELEKIDNNNYTLTVPYEITSVNINAISEDTKAIVSGIGVKKLEIGENNIEVIITSEYGEQNKINIKITRKDGYYLEDFDSIINNEKIKDIDIIINADSIITKEQIEKIKKSGKVIRLNCLDENKKLLYSWSINGKKIKDINEFVTIIDFIAENNKEIYKLSNYADGLYINFKHNNNLPEGAKIKLYVGNKFNNNDDLNIYNYNNIDKKLDFIKDNIIVLDGYIEFEIEKGSEYFITMSTINNKVDDNSSTNIFKIITILSTILIIGLVTYIFMLIKFLNKEQNNIALSKKTENNISDTSNEIININVDQINDNDSF